MTLNLNGSLPVLPTPFLDNRIDFDSLSRLFDHIFPELEGYTLGGSNGESVSLSMDERLELMRFAAKNRPSGKRIVVGLTNTNLAEMIVLAHAAEDLGLDAGLVPCPYYFPNSFEMVLEFFRALDRATSLPIVFYDNPVTTKTNLSAAQILRMVEACEHLAAVKMTDHDVEKITPLRKAGVPVFAGEDSTTFRSLLLGVTGSMTIAPSIFPAAYQETVRLLNSGNASESLRVFSQSILPFIHLLGPGDEMCVTKAIFHHMGIIRSDEMRLPLLRCTPERISHVVLSYDLCVAGSAIAGRR
jgi:4-hydroxy-tetrahydrodipicolinate synthase